MSVELVEQRPNYEQFYAHQKSSDDATVRLTSGIALRSLMADHPHVGATHSLITQSDGTFAVEVTFPGAPLTKVTGFATQALAEGWIKRHKAKIATGHIFRVRWAFGPRR